MSSGLDGAGGEHKEPAAVPCPLAGRARAASPAQKLWQWAPVELRPGPGRAAKLAWPCAEDCHSLALWAAPGLLGRGCWGGSGSPRRVCKDFQATALLPTRLGCVGRLGPVLNSQDPVTLSCNRKPATSFVALQPSSPSLAFFSPGSTENQTELKCALEGDLGCLGAPCSNLTSNNQGTLPMHICWRQLAKHQDSKRDRDACKFQL